MSANTGIQPEYVSVAQAKVITGLSEKTLRRALADQRLQCHRVGHAVRIPTLELRRWMESNGAAPGATTP